VDFANAIAGGRCRIGDGYISTPDFPDSAPDKVQPSGPAVNPYYSLSTTRTSHQLRDDDRHMTGMRPPA